jgi:hypothetical protein
MEKLRTATQHQLAICSSRILGGAAQKILNRLLDPTTRRLVYERLWFELTIVGRDIWSDPAFSDEQKLEGLKWLNELHHRVWGAHQNPGEYAVKDIVGTLQAHAQQMPNTKFVLASLNRALVFVVPNIALQPTAFGGG